MPTGDPQLLPLLLLLLLFRPTLIILNAHFMSGINRLMTTKRIKKKNREQVNFSTQTPLLHVSRYKLITSWCVDETVIIKQMKE